MPLPKFLQDEIRRVAPLPTPRIRRIPVRRSISLADPKIYGILLFVLVGSLMAIIQIRKELPQTISEKHMAQVTETLYRLGWQHANIKNDDDAQAAVRALAFSNEYYRPQPGYRGSKETEEKLARTRLEAMARIASALEDYSGERVGLNVELWLAWARAKGFVLADDPAIESP